MGKLASFRKSKSQKEEPAEVATTPGKIPRRGVLGKMGMTKSEKKIRTGSKSKNVQASVVQFPIKWETEPMPAPIEDKETPVTEDAPADTTEPKDAEDAPMEEEKAAEERGEETEQPVAMEPVEEQTAPVE